MNDPDHDQLDRLRACLIDVMGGAELFRAANEHFGEGLPLDDVAARSGMSRSTLHRKLNAMRSKLAEHGLMPNRWRRQRPGRPAKPGIYSTGAELHTPISKNPTRWDEAG